MKTIVEYKIYEEERYNDPKEDNGNKLNFLNSVSFNPQPFNEWEDELITVKYKTDIDNTFINSSGLQGPHCPIGIHGNALMTLIVCIQSMLLCRGWYPLTGLRQFCHLRKVDRFRRIETCARAATMLQQILRDMYIDPELLAELGEDQKQTLFCRMREEQVRRWRIWDKEQEKLAEQQGPKPERKTKVTFLEGIDGNPWTWVMGEHPDDKTIEQILEEEAREKARKIAEKETQKLRKSVEAELSEILDMNQKQIQQLEAANAMNRLKEKTPMITMKDEPSDIYCSVDELRKKMQGTHPFENEKPNLVQKMNASNAAPLYKNKVAATVAQWEKRVMEERTSQIFNSLQKKLLEVAKEAEDAEKRQETLWREQEKKAKEAEQQIREIARRAREEHRRTSCCDPEALVDSDGGQQPKRSAKEPSSIAVGSVRPRSREAITEWFRTSEYERRAAIDEKNQIAPWFHGIISRQEAEQVLAEKPVGHFLVRISERIWGYAISYKDVDRCKHYLIDASNGRYQFLGPNQMVHKTLGELIAFHETNAITVLGGELLRTPCPPARMPEVFRGLMAFCAR